ncbi:hypothetical protein MY3296_001653 [Beauveria thailandica]
MANIANMTTMTLMEFLQNDPRTFRHYNRGQSDNTTSNSTYQVAGVNTFLPWPQFSLGNIMNQFGGLLNNVRIASDAHPATPPPRFAAEDCLREVIAMYADRPVRRALARTFAHIAASPGNPLAGRTEITLGAGSSAVLVGGFVPDRAMYDPHVDDSINRLPGEIKPSWKWKSAWADLASPQHHKFTERLSQLSFYMLQQGYRQAQHSGARYGFILTDYELVAFRKEDTHGTISMSEPVRWGRPAGQQPRLTVLLALWYLGMLASHDDDWNLDAQPGDPTDEELFSRQRRAGNADEAAGSSRRR